MPTDPPGAPPQRLGVNDGPPRRLTHDPRHPSVSPREEIRFARAVELVSTGIPATEALWTVLSDPLIGSKKAQDLAAAGKRFTEAQLRVKFTRLLEIFVPVAVERSKAEVELFLSGKAMTVASELAKNASTTKGTIAEAAGVSAQTKAADTFFRILGFVKAQTTAAPKTAVQINVGDVSSIQIAAQEIIAGKKRPVRRIEDELPPEPSPGASVS